MAELIVVGFDNPYEADSALTEMRELQRESLIDLEDAAVVVRDPDGRLRLKQGAARVGAGAAPGSHRSPMWGALVDLLSLNPLTGFVAGPALGADSEARSGNLADYGMSDDFIRSVGRTLQPNTSALFVLVRRAQAETMLEEMSHFRGRVIRSSLSPEQEARLQAALSGGAVAAPGTAAPAATGAETSRP